MNITRVLAATLAGAFTMFLLGFLVFGMLLANYFKEQTITYDKLMKDPPDMIPLILFNVAFAWLIAFIFDYWAGIRTFVSGLKGGALIMLPIAIGIDLQYLAFMNLYKDSAIVPTIIDIVLVTAIAAIAGGVIGSVLSMFDRKAELE